MSERDQAKDAGHEQKPHAQIAEQQAQGSTSAGGIFGLPAMMQSAELSGQPQDDAHDAETAQSADLLAHGGWEAIEGGGGLGGVDEGEGGRAAQPDEQLRADSGGGRAHIDEAIARLRAAVAAGIAAVEAAAAEAQARIEQAAGDGDRRLEARHCACVAALGRAVHHRRTLTGAASVAGGIHGEGREAVRWSMEAAGAAVADAAEGGREGLLALEALHADRIERRAGDDGALAQALAAVERAVRVATGRIRTAVEAVDEDVGDAVDRAGERFDRLVADVRYAEAQEARSAQDEQPADG